MIVHIPYSVQQQHEHTGLLIWLLYKVELYRVDCTELNCRRKPGRSDSVVFNFSFFDKAFLAQIICWGLQIQRINVFLDLACAHWEDIHLHAKQSRCAAWSHWDASVQLGCWPVRCSYPELRGVPWAPGPPGPTTWKPKKREDKMRGAILKGEGEELLNLYRWLICKGTVNVVSWVHLCAGWEDRHGCILVVRTVFVMVYGIDTFQKEKQWLCSHMLKSYSP